MRGLLATAALALIGTACSSDPLYGTWSETTTFGMFTGTETLRIDAGGSLSVTLTATSGSCSGSWNSTGYHWAATDSSITFSGTPTCSGSITCGDLHLGCSGSSSSVKDGSCTYALSNDNNTLTLTACTGTSDLTFTRAD